MPAPSAASRRSPRPRRAAKISGTGGADADRQVPQRADRRAHHLAVVDIDAGVADDDRVGAGRVGAADDRAGVAGVAHVGQHADERVGRQVAHRDAQGDVEHAAYGSDPLRGLRVAHGREHLGAHLVHPQLGRAGSVDDGRMPLGGLGRDVDVAHELGTEGHGLAHGLGPLGEELTRARTHRAPGQRPHCLDPIGSGVGQHEGSRRSVCVALRCRMSRDVAQAASPAALATAALAAAGTLARDTSTSAVKAAASLTARSARILRSTSTPASLRPCMNRL